MFDPYYPQAYSDFTDPARRSAFELAIAGVGEYLGKSWGLVIGGEWIETGSTIASIDPSQPDRVVGTIAAGDAALAGDALDAAWRAFPGWSGTDAVSRARLGLKLAEIMRAHTYELAALMVYEAGKNWAEAEGDVAEAVDFVTYYAHQAVEMDKPLPVVQIPGEVNESRLIPMGAGVAIPPWNFPLAILVGMVMGPVMAGNTMVCKPASNTPILGARWMQMVEEAGIPPGVVNYLPGAGSEIGDTLVDHPRTRFINFTGSKEVGLRIAERSSVVGPGQRWLKRAYMELGGKDAMIVDETADLEAAAADVVRSAFGYQGQKCSAASRLILVDTIHDEVLDRVVKGAAALEMGPGTENFAIGPVISASQHKAVLAEIESGKSEAELALGGSAVDKDGGYYIEPTIFAGVDRDARLAQHEIFGPVLSVIRAGDFDDALDIANDTDFGLTGGLYSQDRDRLDRAAREFHVGNLYLNRKITGALVGVQPFGGFNLSGSNAKAGGPDYLRLFMEMKSIAERV